MALGAEAEIAAVAQLGGMVPAVESGYAKARLVASLAARRARIESGEDMVVGVNCFQAAEPSPLTADADVAVCHVDPAHEHAVRADLGEWRRRRDQAAVRAAVGRLRAVVGRIAEVIRVSRNLPPSPGWPGDQAGMTQQASAASTER